MPRQVKHHTKILDAIGKVAIISELVERGDAHGRVEEGRGGEGGKSVAEQTGPFVNELDLDVIAYGRNYNGKKVGPYVKLLVYDGDEEVIREGDWGGNTFYIVVEGSLDVYVTNDEGQTIKVGALSEGTSFGEMAIL